jgi:hypothetical protein
MLLMLLMVARTLVGSKSNQRLRGIYQAAKALGVSRSHLWRVLTGRRSSASLLSRYEALRGKSKAKNPTRG